MKNFLPQVAAMLVLTLAAGAGAHSAPSLAPAPAAAGALRLSDAERSRLRFKLENLWNEVDLLIRNQRVDRSDLKRQEREFGQLRVFERIPTEAKMDGLKRELADEAKEHGFELTSFRVTGHSKPGPKPPAWIFTDEREFQLKPDQIAEEIRFRAEFRGQAGPVPAGNDTSLRNWVKEWPTHVVRLTETAGEPRTIEARGGETRWAVDGKAFRFLPVRYPELRPRNPVSLLPTAARHDLDGFARAEPLLWSFVTRVRENAPKTRPLYDLRSQFFLNDRRMAFFMSKSP